MTALKPDNDNTWAVLDLANKITFTHHVPALLVFRFLAKCTDGRSKRCWPGYALISAMCGGMANSTISRALDYLYDLGVLRLVKPGHGNQHGEYNESNVYEFNIVAMRHVLKHQGIYNASERILHGKALTERVKLLSSLTLPSMPSAELLPRSAELPEESAELRSRPAELPSARVSHSMNHLSANPNPSIDQPSAKPAPAESSASAGLIPVGCWRVDDLRFDFDSSFVLPAIAEEIQTLAALRDLHKRPVVPRTSPTMPEFIFPPMSIFGHADPVGNDAYNKLLAGRRAAAIYGLLTRRTEVWEDLFSNQGNFAATAAGDKWGDSALQTMQATTALPAGTLRPTLFRAYMDAVCALKGPDGKPLLDSKGQPAQLTLDPTNDFLARNQDGLGKGDFQGCGEFNPQLIFSQQENDAFEQAEDKSLRNAANAINRRVLVLLFRPGSKVLSPKWPCPRAKEGTPGCVKRFWSDGNDRRSRRLPDQRRRFQDTHDIFACRFYHRLVTNSPCERSFITFEIRLYSPAGVFIPSAPFELRVGSGRPKTGVTNEKGILVAKDVEVPNQCSIRWGYPPPPGREPVLIFNLDMFLNSDEQKKKEEEAAQKLHNLGYPINVEFSANVTSFQRDYGDLATPPLQLTGQLDEDTFQLVRDVYGSCKDDLSQQQPQRDSSS